MHAKEATGEIQYDVLSGRTDLWERTLENWALNGYSIFKRPLIGPFK